MKCIIICYELGYQNLALSRNFLDGTHKKELWVCAADGKQRIKSCYFVACMHTTFGFSLSKWTCLDL